MGLLIERVTLEHRPERWGTESSGIWRAFLGESAASAETWKWDAGSVPELARWPACLENTDQGQCNWRCSHTVGGLLRHCKDLYSEIGASGECELWSELTSALTWSLWQWEPIENQWKVGQSRVEQGDQWEAFVVISAKEGGGTRMAAVRVVTSWILDVFEDKS